MQGIVSGFQRSVEDHLLGHFLSVHHSLGTTGEGNICLGWRDEQHGYKSPSILPALTTLEGE